MDIPIPVAFGQHAKCENRYLPFVGVDWFKWTKGIEYTYFFSTSDEWHPFDFYTTFENVQPCIFSIPDNLLLDTFIKDRGYPLKGRGYATGVFYKEEKTYIDFIITSNYFAHIRVQCDSNGRYIPNGDIIFPMSWDTEEKQERAILKSIKFLKGKPLLIKAPEPKQLTIFDLFAWEKNT